MVWHHHQGSEVQGRLPSPPDSCQFLSTAHGWFGKLYSERHIRTLWLATPLLALSWQKLGGTTWLSLWSGDRLVNVTAAMFAIMKKKKKPIFTQCLFTYKNDSYHAARNIYIRNILHWKLNAWRLQLYFCTGHPRQPQSFPSGSSRIHSGCCHCLFNSTKTDDRDYFRLSSGVFLFFLKHRDSTCAFSDITAPVYSLARRIIYIH